MKNNYPSMRILIPLLPIILFCSRHPVWKGPYLGQAPPGLIPEVFAPGIISYGFHERCLTFSPDRTELFYATTDNNYIHHYIVQMKIEKNSWSAPEIASFSGIYSDMLPSFSPDRKRLYFTSRRPVEEENRGLDIWYVEREEGGWSDPVNPGSPLNTDGMEGSPAISENGNLYFQAMRSPEQNWDLFVSRILDEHFSEPVNLGSSVNTPYNESAPFIAPDESYLLFHSNRPGGFGIMDIYISFRKTDGTWGEPVNLGKPVNTPLSEFSPTVSPDGKFLFFSSWRPSSSETFSGKSYKEMMDLLRSPENGNATIYWISTDILDALKPKEQD